MRHQSHRNLLLVLGILLVLTLPKSSPAQFIFTTNSAAIIIAGYTGSGGKVTIPSVINGYPVTAIGDIAFSFQAAVTDVIIPDSVTTIGNEAFQNCSGLTNLTIGNGVTNIGPGAFYSCSGLTGVTIPNSVTSISSFAFHGCSGLKSVMIGNGTTNIGSTAFGDCSGLTNIAVDAANPSYAGAGGALFNKTLTALIEYPQGLAGGYAIPNSVTNIAPLAFFDCSGLTNVTIGNNVTWMGSSAFFGCSGLLSVMIPESVTVINPSTFNGCYSLTNIAVDAANPRYASVGGVLFFDKSLTMLVECPPGLTGSYVIPDSVTWIGSSAFDGCTNLRNVIIPDSVTNIGGFAFGNCSGLTNLTIGNGLTNIGPGAFYSCSGLTSVTIPNSVVSIGDSAFSDCSSLTNLTIGNSVSNIGPEAFYSCSGLTSVTIPNSVISIGDSAFSDCSGLPNIIIGNSVANVGAQAFEGCFGLTNAMIPNSVTNIGLYAFHYCSRLNAAYFQGNAPSVNGGAASADYTVFSGESGTVFFLPGTTGWGATFGGWPTTAWYQPQPRILSPGHGFGAQSNSFQFTISWATNTPVVVEASTNLLNWIPVVTNTLLNGTDAFEDSTWTNYLQRFYRARSQ